jgi:hypothetical protein
MLEQAALLDIIYTAVVTLLGQRLAQELAEQHNFKEK